MRDSSVIAGRDTWYREMVVTPPKPSPLGVDLQLVLIETRRLLRECLSRWLEGDNGAARVRSCSTPDEIAALLDREEEVHLLIFSIGSSEATDPRVVEAVELLRRDLPEVPIVLLTEREDIADVREAIRAGIRGYIPTSLSSPMALEALHFVRKGGTFVPASALADDDREPSLKNGRGDRDEAIMSLLDGLTPREREVLIRLGDGKTNKEIAASLNIGEGTVKIHVQHIMRKLNASNRTQAAVVARGLVKTPE